MSHETHLIDHDVAIPTPDGRNVAEHRTIQVPAYHDPDTGELVLTGEAMRLIDEAKARFMGILSADEIRAVRHRLGFTQAQIADLLQAGAKTYTRWESGRARPSRLANVILCALRDGRIDVPYLRSVQGGSFDWRAKVVHHDFRRAPVTLDLPANARFASDETVAAGA